MDALTIGLLAGAALGALKGASDKKSEAEDRKVAAMTQRWSPWTGIAAQPIQRADPFGALLQGGLTGAMVGQKIDGKTSTSDDSTDADPNTQLANNSVGGYGLDLSGRYGGGTEIPKQNYWILPQKT